MPIHTTHYPPLFLILASSLKFINEYFFSYHILCYFIFFIYFLQDGKSSSGIVHERNHSSPSSLIDLDGFNEAGGRASSPRYETPPGTPPPPYQLGSTGTKNSFEVGIRGGKQVTAVAHRLVGKVADHD